VVPELAMPGRCSGWVVLLVLQHLGPVRPAAQQQQQGQAVTGTGSSRGRQQVVLRNWSSLRQTAAALGSPSAAAVSAHGRWQW